MHIESVDFAIITRGRTGSTALAHDLNAHSQISCHQELFRSAPIFDENDIVPIYGLRLREQPTLSIADYLSEVKSCCDQTAQGFKILIGHFNERPGLWEHLLNRRFLVIYLIRDPLGEALSGAIANARGLYNLHPSSSDYARLNTLRKPVCLDPQWVCNEIKYSIHTTKTWREKLRACGVPHITVTYEKYCGDKKKFLAEIHQFLGVEPDTTGASTPFEKVTSTSVWDDIINRDEMLDALRRLGYGQA